MYNLTKAYGIIYGGQKLGISNEDIITAIKSDDFVDYKDHRLYKAGYTLEENINNAIKTNDFNAVIYVTERYVKDYGDTAWLSIHRPEFVDRFDRQLYLDCLDQHKSNITVKL